MASEKRLTVHCIEIWEGTSVPSRIFLYHLNHLTEFQSIEAFRSRYELDVDIISRSKSIEATLLSNEPAVRLYPRFSGRAEL